MQLEARITIDLSGIKHINRVIEQGLRTGSGPVGTMFKQWAARYRGFIQRRFNKYSKGGGDWPPLKASTIAGRRKGGGKGKKVKTAKGNKVLGKVAILRDTSTLYQAVQPVFIGAPGQLQQKIPAGIRVGFGGPHKHPSAKNLTVADLAEIHQLGKGNVPARKIIVDPHMATKRGMRDDAQRMLDRLATE